MDPLTLLSENRSTFGFGMVINEAQDPDLACITPHHVLRDAVKERLQIL